VIDGRPVTSSSSSGRLLTDLDLTLGRDGDVKSVSRNNVPMYTAGRTPVTDVQALIDRYDQLSAPLRRTPVGKVGESITNDEAVVDDSGENPLGNLIADAQLADTAAADRGDADGALMNPGGVRNDLLFPQSAGEGDGVVTYEEAFNVQPFNNIVTTQTFTGTQFLAVLKDQWCDGSAVNVLLPSHTITYTYDPAVAAAIKGKACAGELNPVSDVRIGGVPLDPDASYRITTNNFLADGGDSFPSLRAGTNRTSLSDFDIDSLVRYLQPSLAAGAPAVMAPPTDRIDLPQ
jgi:5'-nucleotidase